MAKAGDEVNGAFTCAGRHMGKHGPMLLVEEESVPKAVVVYLKSVSYLAEAMGLPLF